MARFVMDHLRQEQICAIVAVGCPRRVAARYVGCHLATIRRACKRLPEFAARLRLAESSHELRHLNHLNSAATDHKNWRAAAWMLERRYPQRYGARRPGTLTTAEVVDLLDRLAEIVISEVPAAAQREAILRRLAELTSAVPRHNSEAASQPDDEAAAQE